MSRAVLENYLERSISFTELLHDDLTKPRNNRGVNPRDNMRLILQTKAKLVGRALMVWGREKELSAFLETAKPYAGALHKAGWSCEHLPYLVEFDNFGRSNPGKPSKSPFIWGWDEITWFALMPEQERNEWLRYAFKWVKDTDPNGHLQMPGSRIMTPGTTDGPRWYWANTRSDACPNGLNTEETIKEIWGRIPKR